MGIKVKNIKFWVLQKTKVEKYKTQEFKKLS